ncbi:hypothetical protein A2662_00225 [Candidatus Giovannonibacteria bacterium RIFCSPHIGHO2_01_FULL_45_33]|uniref:Uncharacterized protein n=1 Tax=Candidatus Giovannonibacteria bacterium RIFCSPLOWO2_01_FULL_45_34 TaxID=1798351 RepID=A0A1F5X0P8_9BACT|nr:MAG: hypothetical protein A2662_00225 [Candidatus Giovannonibacteria bacterium RIFCSPHIGHO2_01_FULL_45_33]OGF70744.1 MAG: hypothetical protein A3C73_03175 [Candidatus Giovannonibacteria bacterium RIFCSPHIGHO2_02_FULL_44_11]OGF81466.1 MAG: hypothetical protein A2930_04450 [Candidatus Giovannonibacteria bacterium RIFCSPLOWO2_01_FULL_45_34]
MTFKYIKKLFGINEKSEKNDFSLFFSGTDSKYKVKFLEEVARKANEDQRSLMEKHNKLVKERA